MDIYEYLKKDHKKVADLFAQFEKQENLDRQVEIFNLINLELFLHAESEQATFYKRLEANQNSMEEVKHAEKEHREIEEKLLALAQAAVHDNVWKQGVLDLKKLVDHHVSEEEGKIFNKAKKVLSAAEAYFVKEEMHYLKMAMKQKIMTAEEMPSD